MLQIGIDHRHKGALDDSMPSMQAPASPAADPAQAPHAEIGGGNGLYDIARAVGRFVVDEYDFPVDAFEHRVQPLDQLGDIAAFLEGGHDNGSSATGPACARAPGSV